MRARARRQNIRSSDISAIVVEHALRRHSWFWNAKCYWTWPSIRPRWGKHLKPPRSPPLAVRARLVWWSMLAFTSKNTRDYMDRLNWIETLETTHVSGCNVKICQTLRKAKPSNRQRASGATDVVDLFVSLGTGFALARPVASARPILVHQRHLLQRKCVAPELIKIQN